MKQQNYDAIVGRLAIDQKRVINLRNVSQENLKVIMKRFEDAKPLKEYNPNEPDEETINNQEWITFYIITDDEVLYTKERQLNWNEMNDLYSWCTCKLCSLPVYHPFRYRLLRYCTWKKLPDCCVISLYPDPRAIRNAEHNKNSSKKNK